MILWAVLLILASARAAHLPSPKHDSSNLFLLFQDETDVSSEAAISRGKRSNTGSLIYQSHVDKCAEIRGRGGAADLLKGYLKNEPTATPDDTTTEVEWFVQAMEELTTSAKELRALSKKMESTPSSIPAEEYIKMHQASEETKRKFKLKLDQAKKNAKKNAYQCSHDIFREIEPHWQEILEKMKKTMQDLNRSIIEREIFSLIASDVGQEKYDEAVQKFLILDNDTLLNLVVARAYGIGKVPNILKFVEKVSPSQWHHIQAVNKLVDEIIAHNDTSSPMSLLISSHVSKQFPVSSISVENKPMLEQINRKLSAPKLSVVDSLAKQIATGSYQPTLDFQKKYGMEDQLLNDIIIRAYDIDHAANILIFIDRLPRADLNCALYTFLKEVDAHNDTSSSISLLILGHYNKRPAEADVGAKCKTLFDSTRIQQLSATKLSVMNTWVEQIRNGNNEEILEFCKKYGVYSVFNSIADDVVKRTFQADRDVIMNLVYLSYQLTYIEAQISMSVELYNQMKSASQVTLEPVVRIAYQLKELMQRKNYKNVNDYYKRKLNSAWDEFPKELKAIVSEEAVCLKDGNSTSDNRYLYVKNNVDDYKDYVDTGILTGDGAKENAISHRWKFQVEVKEGEFYFYIKSYYHRKGYGTHDDYLYASDNGDKSQTYTWRKSTHVKGDEWDLVDIDWRNGKFLLRNRLFNYYLNNDGAYISGGEQQLIYNYEWKIETKCNTKFDWVQLE